MTFACTLALATPAGWAADARAAEIAAMQGRKADALAAVQRLTGEGPLRQVLAGGDSGWQLTPQYTALVRFGLWDELLAMRPPDARAPGLTAGYLYARGVALAARGRLAEARSTLDELQRLAATIPPDLRAGANTLRAVLDVALPVVGARIAASELRSAAAVTLLERAVAAEDQLVPATPADWFFPVRELLGAQLLASERPAAAERVYRVDLRHNPGNGWSLYGLSRALRAERQIAAARLARREFESAWKAADVRLVASAFWFAGPDTTRCECQREASANR
jgi:tetratricopeptide (TPR) repeat protein